MERLDLHKIIDHQFIDYVMAREGLKYIKFKDEFLLNQNRIHYEKNSNRLLFLNIQVVADEVRFYILAVDLQFIVEEKKENQPLDAFLEDLKKKYFLKVQINFSIPGQEVTKDGKTVYGKFGYKKTDDPAIIPQNFIVNCKGDLLAFYSQRRIFICNFKLNPANQVQELTAKELTLDEGTLDLDSIKWHPESPVHLGFLTNNRFMIYDVSENLEDPEFSLSLSTKKKSRNVIAFPGDEPKDEKSHMVDFCFCTQDRLEDFRFLSVFFMNSHGEIYYYAPIILGKIAVDEVELLDLKRRTFEKWEGTDDAPECDEYYKALFDCLLTNSSLEHTKLVLKSVANTPYESLNNKNSIQGPIQQHDGNSRKVPKRRKDYVAMYRIPHKRSHIFVTVRRNGKVTFLLSLSSAAPNPKPSAPVWDNETPFQFAVIAKYQLPNFLPEFRQGFQASDKSIDTYNQIRKSFGIKFLDTESIKTKVMLLYYNRVYLFHLEWADLVEKSLETRTALDKIPNREEFRTDLEVLLEKPADIISVDSPDLKNFNPYNYGFLGVTAINGNLFVVNTDGTACDYTFLRTVLVNDEESNDKRPTDTKIGQLPTFAQMDEEMKYLMQKAKELDKKQESFSTLISTVTKFGAKKDDYDKNELEEIEKWFTAVSSQKEIIEDDFAARINFLKELHTKQRDILENLSRRVRDLREKKEKLQGKVFEPMITKNNRMKEKIKKIMENLKNIISPLSAEDIKCKQTLEETQKKLAETRKALEEVKQRAQQIKEAKKAMSEHVFRIQDASLFQQFNKGFSDLKAEIGELNGILEELEDKSKVAEKKT